MGTVRPPSPESAVASSRKDALNREPTFGLAGAAVEKPVEEPLTSPDGATELSGAFDPSSAGAGSLGGGTESVVPVTASEPLRRFGGRLLPAEACVNTLPTSGNRTPFHDSRPVCKSCRPVSWIGAAV